MRSTITFLLGLLLLLGVAVKAHAESCGASSKSCFSKNLSRSVIPAPADAAATPVPTHLARITAYWPGEDYFTTHKRSATGVRLRPGFCAVDPNLIPYGSLVIIPGVGNFLAMDTGTAVISRKAAKESGHTRTERSALVVDIYFASRKAGELFMRDSPKFAMIAWGSADTLVASNP
jgi:3D (Asp-Asp-Asp) domain-containing protein